MVEAEVFTGRQGSAATLRTNSVDSTFRCHTYAKIPTPRLPLPVPRNQACAAHSLARSSSTEPVTRQNPAPNEAFLFHLTGNAVCECERASLMALVTHDSVSKDSSAKSQCVSYLIPLALSTPCL